MTMKALLSTAALAVTLGGMSAVTPAMAQTPIALGNLVDYSGPTSDVGTPYGQGIVDTYAWINKHGGINNTKVNVDTVDYSYQVPRAIAQYKKWSGADKVAAILGWGTADTEALTGFLAERQDSRHVGVLRRRPFRPDRRRRQGKAGSLQLLLRSELFGRRSRHADLGCG